MQYISMQENCYLDSTASASSHLSSVSSVIMTTCLKLLTFTSLSLGGDFVVVFKNIFCVSSNSSTWLGIFIPLLLLQNWIHKCCGASYRRSLEILFEFAHPRLPNITKKKKQKIKIRVQILKKEFKRLWNSSVVTRALIISRQCVCTNIVEKVEFL